MKVKIVQESPVKKSSLSGIVSVSISLPTTSSSSRKFPHTLSSSEDGTFLDSTSAIYNTSVMDENSELWSDQ